MQETATVDELRAMTRRNKATLYKLLDRHGIRPVGVVQLPGGGITRGPRARVYPVAAVLAVATRPGPKPVTEGHRLYKQRFNRDRGSKSGRCVTKPPDEVTEFVEPGEVQAEPEFAFGGGGLTFSRRDLDEMARRRAKFQPQG